MGRYIIKLKDRYFDYSTVVDAPVTEPMTLDAYRAEYCRKFGQGAIRELDQRLERVEVKGTSSHIHSSAWDTIAHNRAGPEESCLSMDEFLEWVEESKQSEAPDKEPWIYTYTGTRYYIMNPTAEQMNIRDIAHALARLCRFGGHTQGFYSVAQHSVLVSRTVPSQYALEGLLHDASEAYLGDMIHPLKQNMPEYRALEDRTQKVVAEAFGLTYPFPPSIGEADRILLGTEARDVLATPKVYTESLQPLPERIKPWDHHLAECAFLDRYTELTEAK